MIWYYRVKREMAMDVSTTLASIGRAAKIAAAELAFADPELKKSALFNAAEYLWDSRSEIMSANSKDIEFGKTKKLIGCHVGSFNAR
jgi:glutamate-5-semialdehyde dehydrogenase